MHTIKHPKLPSSSGGQSRYKYEAKLQVFAANRLPATMVSHGREFWFAEKQRLEVSYYPPSVSAIINVPGLRSK